MTKARFPDPYDGMSDDELDRHFSTVILENRARQEAISIRFPGDLLTEIRQLAREMGVGYQTLIKNLLARDLAQLQKRSGSSRLVVRHATTSKSPATAKRSTRKRAVATTAQAKKSRKGQTPRPRVSA